MNSFPVQLMVVFWQPEEAPGIRCDEYDLSPRAVQRRKEEEERLKKEREEYRSTAATSRYIVQRLREQNRCIFMFARILLAVVVLVDVRFTALLTGFGVAPMIFEALRKVYARI